MPINPNYWPDTVAFKRYIRELTRQINYVPPTQQPTPQNSLATAATTDTPAPLQEQQGVRVGPWVLDTDDHGSLVARHDGGEVRIIASLNESETGNG